MINSSLDMTQIAKVQEALKTSEMQLSGILNGSLDGIMAFRSVRDEKGKIVDFEWLLSNPSACDLFKRKAEDLIGNLMLQELPGNLEEGLFADYVRVVESGEPSQREFYYNYDGIDSWFENMAVKLGDGFAVTFRNITPLKHSEQALQQANHELQVRIQDLKQRNADMESLSTMSDFLQACLTVEEALKAISNLLEPLFPGCSGGLFITSSSRDRVEQAAAWGSAVYSSGDFPPNDCWGLRRGQVHAVGPDRPGLRCKHFHPEAEIAMTLCIPTIAQGETLGLFSLAAQRAEDLPESKQQLARTVAEQVSLAIANLKLRETLQNQSIRDPLTGLFNRRYLEEFLTQELARAQRKKQPFGVIMIDIDHFKTFNDTYGHDAGDHVLQTVCTLLKDSVRESDIACRYGGEEMTLIFPESSLTSTAERAEVIRTTIAQLSLHYNGQEMEPITASFGIAAFPKHGTTSAVILQAADTALYRAKAAGRNCVMVAL